MPALKNARHELAVLFRLRGNSQIDAYEKAGYSRKSVRACSVFFNRADVKARMEELRAEVHEKIVEREIVSLESLTKEFTENREFAKVQEAPAAMNTATSGKAKLHGFMTDKHEHTGAEGGPMVVEMSDMDLARRIAFLLSSAANATQEKPDQENPK